MSTVEQYVEYEWRGSVLVVRVRDVGRNCIHDDHGVIRARMLEFRDEPGHVVVDFSDLHDVIVSKRAFRWTYELWKARHDRGDSLAVAGMNDWWLEVFELFHLHRLISVLADVDAAVRHLLQEAVGRLTLADATALQLREAADAEGCHGVLCDRLEEIGHPEAERIRGLVRAVEPMPTGTGVT